MPTVAIYLTNQGRGPRRRVANHDVLGLGLHFVTYTTNSGPISACYLLASPPGEDIAGSAELAHAHKSD